MYTKSSILSFLALLIAVNAQSGSAPAPPPGWAPSKSGTVLRIRDLEDKLFEALQTREILAREAEAEEQDLIARYAEAYAYPDPYAEAYPEAYEDEAYNGYSLNVRGVGDPAPPDANGQPYCLEPSGSVCRKVNPNYQKGTSSNSNSRFSPGGAGGFGGGAGGFGSGSTLAGGATPRIGTTVTPGGPLSGGGSSGGGFGGVPMGPGPVMN